MSRVFTNSVQGVYLLSSSNIFAPIATGAISTYAAWIFPTAFPTGSNQASVLSVGGLAGSVFTEIYVNPNGSLQAIAHFSKSSATAISVASVISLNQWQYVSFTYVQSTGVVRIFIGGVEVSYASQTANVMSSATAVPLWVGNTTATGTADAFIGMIDTVGIWNTVLTSAQMQNAGVFGGTPRTAPANLIGYWPLLGSTSPEPESPVNTFPLSVFLALQGPNSPGQTPGFVVPVLPAGTVSLPSPLITPGWPLATVAASNPLAGAPASQTPDWNDKIQANRVQSAFLQAGESNSRLN